MSRTIVAVLGLALLIGYSTAASAGARLDIALGLKSMNADWTDVTLIGRVPATQGYETEADLDDQAALGVFFTFGRDGWPIDLALDLLASVDDDEVTVVDFDTRETFEIDLEGSTMELDLGIRKSWDLRRARIYLGGGLALVTAERREEDRQDVSVSVEDDAVGAWAGGGAQWKVGRRWSVGFEARVTRAEVSLFGEDVEAGGELFAITGGFAW